MRRDAVLFERSAQGPERLAALWNEKRIDAARGIVHILGDPLGGGGTRLAARIGLSSCNLDTACAGRGVECCLHIAAILGLRIEERHAALALRGGIAHHIRHFLFGQEAHEIGALPGDVAGR